MLCVSLLLAPDIQGLNILPIYETSFKLAKLLLLQQQSLNKKLRKIICEREQRYLTQFNIFILSTIKFIKWEIYYRFEELIVSYKISNL